MRFKSCCFIGLNVPVASFTIPVWKCWTFFIFLALTLWSVAAKVIGQEVLHSFYPGPKHTWQSGLIPCSFSIWNSWFVSSQGRERQTLPEDASVSLRFNLSSVSPGFPEVSPSDCGPKLHAMAWVFELSRMNADPPMLLSTPCTAQM